MGGHNHCNILKLTKVRAEVNATIKNLKTYEHETTILISPRDVPHPLPTGGRSGDYKGRIPNPNHPKPNSIPNPKLNAANGYNEVNQGESRGYYCQCEEPRA